MDIVSLSAQKRDKNGSSRLIRQAGLIPIEFYGSGVENLSLQAPYQLFRKAYQKAGESTLIDLNVEGHSDGFKTLVHDVQFDPMSGAIIHVDLINVRMDQEVHTNIPLEFVGESPAVKNLSGVLATSLDSLEVKCLPQYLVHSFLVNISGLVDFNAAIHVKDLVVSEHITVLNDPEQMVVTVSPPRAEEEEAAPVAAEGVVPEAGAEGAVVPPAEGESEEKKEKNEK